MADMAQQLSDLYSVPVVEGVSVAVRLAELLTSLELQPRANPHDATPTLQ